MLLADKKIIAVILSHNCEHLIERTLKRIPKNTFNEIIVSDDGSTDNSVEVYKKKGFKVFETKNGGYGSNVRNAVKSAFACGADYAVEIHGDGAQFNPSAITDAKKLMESNTTLILGSRFLTKGKALKLGMPLPRYLANRGMSFFDRIILNKDLSEFHTGFRIYNKDIIDVYNDQFSDDHICSFQIIAATIARGFSVEEIEVECNYRAEHTSHSYAGASIYAILHFWILFQFILHKYLNLSYGVFKNE